MRHRMNIFQGKTGTVLYFAAVLIITFIVFLPVLKFEFINWDDHLHVYKNPHIQSLSYNNIKEIFKETISRTYIPLTILSFAIEYHFVKLKPFLYHLDNLVLHLAVVGLIFLLAIRSGLSNRAAAFVGLLFAIHPMHAESVVWVSERKDVLYAFFYMLALNSYWEFKIRERKFAYWLSLFWGFLSMLAKPMAYSLPVVLLLCDILWQKKIDRKGLLEKVPFVFYIGLLLWITFSTNTKINQELISYSADKTVLIWIWTFSFYIYKFFGPFELMPIYTLPQPIAITNFSYAASAMGVTFGIVALIKYGRDRWFLFAVLFYLVSIFIIVVRAVWDFGNLTVVADRFMYLPSLGICLFSGKWLDDRWLLIQKKGPVFVTTAMLCVGGLFFILGFKAWHQLRTWKDSITLWTYQITKRPDVAWSYSYRCDEYIVQGELKKAKEDCTKAIELDPVNFYKSYHNRGYLYSLEGRNDLAVADYDKALMIKPDNADTYYNRGVIYQSEREYEKALLDYNHAIELNPDHPQAYSNRGDAWATIGKNDAALKDYARALSLMPFPQTFNNRGFLYSRLGQYDAALNDYDEALKINSNFIDVFINKGNLFNTIMQYDQAVLNYSRAIELNPSLPFVYLNRSLSYYMLKDYSKAWEDALKAQSMGVPQLENYLEELKRKKSP